MEKFLIKIPATSANLGLGFDSMGIALDKFLTIEASIAEEWNITFEQEALMVLPTDESNMVVDTAITVAKKYHQKMPPLAIHMDSQIPLTHGLGSSSSAIVAGIELANYFCDLQLSQFDKIQIGSDIEGHPDNIGPCITGGIFVGAYDRDGFLAYESAKAHDVGIIISVPPYELSTTLSRSVLPTHYERSDAVMQNALSNVMVLALLKGDYEKMGQMMMRDRLHEPYRQPLISEFTLIRDLCLSKGAYACVISGAGPTVLTLCPQDQAQEILQFLIEQVPECEHEAVKVYQ